MPFNNLSPSSKPKEYSQIIITGPPNSGKTTLFNNLTGHKNKTVNYPGSTVFISKGTIQEKYSFKGILTDTPGVYSLFPKSREESITRKLLFSKKPISTVIVTIDVGKLEAHLPFLFQLKEAGFPLVLVLTMWDRADSSPFSVKTLKHLLNIPVVPMKGLIGEGIPELIEELRKVTSLKSPKPDLRKALEPWTREKMENASNEAKKIIQKCNKTPKKDLFLSEKYDRFFLHPVLGMFLFLAVMFSLFSSLFWLAEPFMSFIDDIFGTTVESIVAFNPHSPILDFIGKGMLGSLGAVLVFVPQIFILFLGIHFLEDSGYLARAVTLVDGFFSRIGLSGRSFVPFLSGYACAIPAALAARGLPSKKERYMTLFAIPFMSCSARLPVYTLLLGFFFFGQASWKPGLFLTLIYFGSLFLGLLSVFFLNVFLPSEKKQPFILDLPLYRRPCLKSVVRNSWHRTKHYLTKAGPVVFMFALLVWVGTRFPGNLSLSAEEQIRQSYAGQIGRIIEPVFEAIGLDWRVGVALLAAFVAREVFVSALALLFYVTRQGEEGSLIGSLIEKMQNAVNSEGELIFTFPSVMALIVFFMFSLQCFSTSAVMSKEMGGKFAFSQFAILNVTAYVMAVLVYQTLSAYTNLV